MQNKDRVRTRVKDLERDVERLQKALKGKEESLHIGQQIAGMDHYIKNILNKLEGGSYMVNTGLNKDKPEVFARGWRIVETNLIKVSDLVMNLLLMSKESEKDPEWCSPNDIAKDVFDLLAQRAENHRLELVSEFEPDLEEYYLCAKEVHRCLLNIGTYIVESCELEKDDIRHCTLMLKTVKAKKGIRYDMVMNGLDLPDDVEGKFIERIDPDDGKEFGLIVARRIAEGEGGTISLETTEKGCKFTLFFPNLPSV